MAGPTSRELLDQELRRRPATIRRNSDESIAPGEYDNSTGRPMGGGHNNRPLGPTPQAKWLESFPRPAGHQWGVERPAPVAGPASPQPLSEGSPMKTVKSPMLDMVAHASNTAQRGSTVNVTPGIGLERSKSAPGTWAPGSFTSAEMALNSRFPGWATMTPEQRAGTLRANRNPGMQVGTVVGPTQIAGGGAPDPQYFNAERTAWLRRPAAPAVTPTPTPEPVGVVPPHLKAADDAILRTKNETGLWPGEGNGQSVVTQRAGKVVRAAQAVGAGAARVAQSAPKWWDRTVKAASGSDTLAEAYTPRGAGVAFSKNMGRVGDMQRAGAGFAKDVLLNKVPGAWNAVRHGTGDFLEGAGLPVPWWMHRPQKFSRPVPNNAPAQQLGQ